MSHNLLSRRQFDRLGTLLLALVLAVVVWVVSVQQKNPVQTTTLSSVPVEVVNLPDDLIFADNGSADIPAVDVRLRAPRNIIETLSVRDLDAFIDLSDAQPGRQEAVIQVEKKISGIDILDKTPEAVVVNLVSVIEKDVPVFANIIDSPPFGYTADAPEVTPTTVTVRGPEPQVERVQRAEVIVRLRDANSDVKIAQLVTLRDGDGAVVTDLAVEPRTVTVVVPIEQQQGFAEKSVRPDIVGQPAPNYTQTGITVDPTTVTIFGDPDTLAQLPGFVETTPININGATETIVERAPLIIPETVSVVAAQAVTVTACDAYGNTATSYTGDHDLTFSGPSASPDGNTPTVTDKTGAPVAVGTATTVTFTSGVSSAGGSMTLYRAEAVSVDVSDGTIDSSGHSSRAELLAEVRHKLDETPGVTLNVGQPLAHRIDHILSGIQAQIAVKVMGTDLTLLRETASRVEQIARGVPGVTDLYAEPQILIPQLHISPQRQRLSEVGLSPGRLASTLETAIGGSTVGTILEGERTFDLFLRLRESERDSVEAIRHLPIWLPSGGMARLGDVALVEEAAGPNEINRDNQLRRIAVSCNVHGRSLGEVVQDLKEALKPLGEMLPEGTFIRLEGQFQSQMEATRIILLLSLVCLVAMLAILYGQFKSMNLAVQVLVCIPAAFVGGIAMLLLTRQPFNVASLVGFVSLAGIATRNGILLVSHYVHLARETELPLGMDLLVQAGKDRAAPVVMTALTTGAGLLPLLLSAGETGREILYPVACVVIGGLATSTLFEFTLRPALFLTFGRRALALARTRQEDGT